MTTQGSTKAEAVRVPAPHRWTRRQYEQMVEAGILDEEDRVELINGEIIEMSPQKGPHAMAVMLALGALQAAYEGPFMVRPQLPLALDPDSEPEPDIAVVAGKPRDFPSGHPNTAILVVEISDATLTQDRTRKVRLYARHGIPEYWILNVVDDCLEVYRDPTGETYQTKLTLHRGNTITPPQGAKPIAVADMLP